MDLPAEEQLPTNFRIASARRRFLATLVNLVAIGGLLRIADWVTGIVAENLNKHALTSWVQVGLVIAFWAVCGLSKSPGATLLMLRRFTDEGRPLTRRASLVRTSPFLLLGLLPHLPWPGRSPSLPIGYVLVLIFLVAAVGLIADGVAVLVSRRSLLDRCFKTVTLQLSLPPHLMPTVFGIRLK